MCNILKFPISKRKSLEVGKIENSISGMSSQYLGTKRGYWRLSPDFGTWVGIRSTEVQSQYF